MPNDFEDWNNASPPNDPRKTYEAYQNNGRKQKWRGRIFRFLFWVVFLCAIYLAVRWILAVSPLPR